jgi:hypothetical protein
MNRRTSLRAVAGLAAVLSAFYLACEGDNTSTDAGPDGGGDVTTQDVVAPDASPPDASPPDGTAPDAAPDGTAPDASPSDGGSDATLDAGDAGTLCTSTGGSVTTAQCCKNTPDFPNTCNTGPCGCSPQNSHTVLSCQCPSNECYTAQLGCH